MGPKARRRVALAVTAVILAVGMGAVDTGFTAFGEETVLFNGTDLAGWRKPTGEWFAAGAVAVDPADPKRFTIEAGEEWLPLQTELDIVPGSALDFSAMSSSRLRYSRGLST